MEISMEDLSKPSVDPRVTVVIPNWNGRKLLPVCLESLRQQSFKDFLVIVVDNASTDDSLSWIAAKYPEIAVIALPENLGFAAAVNIGIAQATTPCIALLNTDTKVDEDWLHYLVARMESSGEDLAAVSPLMLSMSDPSVIDDAGDSLSWYGEATKNGHGRAKETFALDKDIFSPSGGASLFRASFFEACGTFDKSFFAYLEDVDLGLRGRLYGYRYELDSKSIVYHQGHGSKIKRDLYIKLIIQNRLLIFIKNIPLRSLLKNLGRIIYGQLYFLLAYGKVLPSLRGYLGFIARTPEALRFRMSHRHKVKLSDDEINRLLSIEKPGLLRTHLRKLWKSSSIT
jgi:GT2 family glycosyltransferase